MHKMHFIIHGLKIKIDKTCVYSKSVTHQNVSLGSTQHFFYFHPLKDCNSIFRTVTSKWGNNTKFLFNFLSFWRILPGKMITGLNVHILYMEGILSKGPYPPCLRMADRALLAGYPQYIILILIPHNNPCFPAIPPLSLQQVAPARLRHHGTW